MNPLKTLRFILAHPLNRGRPVSALARYAAWQARSRMTDEVTVDWIAGTRLVARRGMTGATGNIYCGLHEYRDMALVLHALAPGDLFVDVGANIGSYTVLASGVCGARTVAVEPEAGAARDLARNVAANGIGHLVDLQVTAVGEGTGSIVFTRGLDTMNRVACHDDPDVQTVGLARLDDLLRGTEPNLIKFDVEGYETSVLRAAERVLATPSLRAVMLETVDPEAFAILERSGFHQCGYDPRTRRLIEAGAGQEGDNALFVRGQAALQARLQSAPRHIYRGREI